MIACVIFIALRWQPEIWLQTQIKQYAEQQGITIFYDRMQRHGFTLQLEHLSIQAAQLPVSITPIILDTLELTPAWSSLFSLHPGVQVQMQWQGQHANAVIIRQDDTIVVHELLATLDVSSLQQLLETNVPLPVKAHGQVQLSGSLHLQSNGQPLQGRVDIIWNTASIDFPPSQTALGDYKLTIESEQAASPWQWNINGGKALILNGKGNIDTSATNPQAWLIHGNIHIGATKEAPALLSILGSTKIFALSGSLTHPQLQAL